MSAQHTQGQLLAVHEVLLLDDGSGEFLAVANLVGCDNAEPNARRLVACWNACEGIPTEELERAIYLNTASYAMRMNAEAQRDHFEALAKDNGATIIKTACELGAMTAQRDELLAALRLAVRQNSHDMLMTGEELRQCEAAIAKHQPTTAGEGPATPT